MASAWGNSWSTFWGNSWGSTGAVVQPPAPTPEVVAPAPGEGGIGQYMEEFARQRYFERRAREEVELEQIAEFDDALCRQIILKLLGGHH